MNFSEAFKLLLGHEGGYTNDPRDPGNWTGGKVNSGELLGTKYGVAASAYPKEDIKNLTLERAQQIYKRDYWDAIRVDELPSPARFSIFDAAVNSGVAQATKWLQRAVGTKDDGIIGPQTVAAALAVDPYRLASLFNGQRLKFMTELKNFDVYGKGWARRIAENLINAG